MVDLTQEEKQLLLAAKKLRQAVQQDINRTAKPLVAPFIKEVVTVLSEDKKIKSTDLQRLPVSAWVKIAGNVSVLMGRTTLKSASSHQARTRETISFVEKSLGTTDNAAHIAATVVLASVKLASQHRKTPSPKLLEALSLVDKAQQEIALLREFV